MAAEKSATRVQEREREPQVQVAGVSSHCGGNDRADYEDNEIRSPGLECQGICCDHNVWPSVYGFRLLSRSRISRYNGVFPVPTCPSTPSNMGAIWFRSGKLRRLAACRG